MTEDFDKQEQQAVNPLKTKMGKTYLKGLQYAVEIGTISVVILQRKLSISHKESCQMLDWMIEEGYVRNDAEYLKTTLLTQQGFDELLHKTGISLKTKREKQSVVDDVLYKASLRLAIRKKRISAGMLRDAFAICKVRADAVMCKMEEDGHIKCLLKKVEILITEQKFNEIYGERL